MNTDLIERTAHLFDVPPDALIGPGRTQRVAYARFALAWALRQNDWSLQEIGALLKRDHTTIIHAIEAAEQRAAESPDYAARLTKLAPDRAIPKRRDSRVAQLEAKRDEWKALAVEAIDAAEDLKAALVLTRRRAALWKRAAKRARQPGTGGNHER
jgi:hypothetical protein